MVGIVELGCFGFWIGATGLPVACGAVGLPRLARAADRALARRYASVIEVERVVEVRVPVPAPALEAAPVSPPEVIEIERVVHVEGPERIIYAPLPDDISTYVTVLDVLTDMGIPPSREITWPVGREAAKAHRVHYGVSPRQITRARTRTGGGTHAYAGYPAEFVPILRVIIGEATQSTAEPATESAAA